MDTIEYADEVVGPYKLYRSEPPGVERTPWGVIYPGQDETGYGKKITTDVVLRFDGSNRRYRVYATCFSNAASHWITYKGKRLSLKTHFQDEILEE